MATERNAKVTWTGSLMEGSGRIEGVGSGAFGPLDVTWASRAEEPAGRTSPEELIAAAWASCFSMALSHGLAGAGTPPERLATSVTVSFQPGEGITKAAIEIVGTVPGVDQDGFVAQAEAAKQNCPVSKAMTGVPQVTLAATLATG
jgi:lipoyl-dependent peroxiredoxin